MWSNFMSVFSPWVTYRDNDSTIPSAYHRIQGWATSIVSTIMIMIGQFIIMIAVDLTFELIFVV